MRHINARGGVLSRPLRQKVYDNHDDPGSPEFAIDAANKLFKDGIKLVIGHPLSEHALATSDIYADNGVLVINPAATVPELTARGHQLSFRTVGTDTLQASAACDWIADKVKPRVMGRIAIIYADYLTDTIKRGAKIAVLHDNRIYDERIASSVREGLKDRGVEVSLYEGVIAGDHDHSAVIERLMQSKIDFVYYGGYSPDLTRILCQARAAGINAVFMSSDAAAACSMDSAGDAAQGLLLTLPGRIYDDEYHPATPRIMPADGPLGRIMTNPMALLSYAAVEVLAQAIAASGDYDDTSKIAQTIRSGTFKTRAGSLSFQPNGDLTTSRFVVEECEVKRLVVRSRAL
jgi:branched-chain amino acid transport system substrate-binding protein